MNTTHLTALQTRLAHEQARHATDGSKLRAVWIAQIQKEIAREKVALGLVDDLPEMTDAELLAALDA